MPFQLRLLHLFGCLCCEEVMAGKTTDGTTEYKPEDHRQVVTSKKEGGNKMQTSRIATAMTVVAALTLLLAASYVVAGPPVEEGELSALAPVGTAFTYQGRLTDGGNPANGSYDLQFGLYDAASDGTLIGTVTEEDVIVTDGLFTVKPDFGAGVFTGDARWLEIGVRPGDSSGAYTTLSPRQALTATPYALYAQRVAEHDHLGQTWTGSNNSLIISGTFGSPDYAPLVLGNADSLGDGLRVASVGDDGVQVDSALGDGVSVHSAGRFGIVVGSAGDNGVHVASALDDGVHVYSAGNPSGASPSDLHNGFEVAGAEGHGLYVGQADQDGVHVHAADGFGVIVDSAGEDGVLVDIVGNPSGASLSDTKDGFEVAGAEGNGLAVGRADRNGVSVGSAGLDGVSVNMANDDGVYVGRAGNPSATSSSESHNGFEVAGTEGHGLYVGQADQDGVHVSSAGDRGVYVNMANNGIVVGGVSQDGVYVDAAGDDGVNVLYAGQDGVHVGSAGRNAVHVDSADWTGLYVSSAHNGVVVESVVDTGVWLYSAGHDGVLVSSAGDPSTTSSSDLDNGLEVRGAEGHGLYVGRADEDGVHVDSAGGYAGYFDGDVQITGAATGFFPRPTWNSGWQRIEPDEYLTLVHNVGGDPDDYVVDLQCKDNDPVYGINNRGIGGYAALASFDGIFYYSLDSNAIAVHRYPTDPACPYVRIRIWLIK
jgi:hypothetical protein